MNALKLPVTVLSTRHKHWLKVAGLHALCWSGYIAVELFVVFKNTGRLESFYIYAVFYALNISFSYGVLWALYAHGIGIAFRLAAVFSAYVSAKLLATLLIYHSGPVIAHWTDLPNALLTPLFRGYIFALQALFYRLAVHLTGYKNKMLQAEKAYAEVRNAYLQQQLDPHLLFNTLGFIYNSVRKHSTEAARAVELLSGLQDFTLRGPEPDGKIPVAAETEQIGHLLELNRLRFEQPLALDYEVSDGLAQARIIPLVLLTLAENVIKHGRLSDQEHPALIRIDVRDGRLTFYSRNHQSGRPAGRGIGLRNTRTRLDYAYPGRYLLEITASAVYELKLTIDL